ncbi:MAG: LCP family protein [Actinobacteria bacterium]|nr:LCP family protein [Actinomycetota bacterium]
MRRFRRTFVAVVALAGVVAAAAAGLPVLPGSTDAAEAAPAFVIGRAPDARHLPALDGSRPIFILVLGSDARRGDVVRRARSDSIHIVAINPAKRKGTVIGFPRDSWVPIPGVGTNKINAAMVAGGPELTVRTIQSLTGIPIDYYVLTSFAGFVRMVNAVGGVVVDVPYRMNDPYSGARFDPGRQRLAGGQALAFARNRKDTPNADFSRSLNQGTLMLGALAEFRKEVSRDPRALLSWIGAAMRNTETDLPLAEVVSLAFTVLSVRQGGMRNVVIPGSVGYAGSASVVFLSGSARSIYANVRDDGIMN